MMPMNGEKMYMSRSNKMTSYHGATKVKWIRHSSQSDEYYIYWPTSHKVLVKGNLIFDTGDRSKLSPILPYEESTDGTVE